MTETQGKTKNSKDGRKKSVFVVSSHMRSLVNFRSRLLQDFQANGLDVHVVAPSGPDDDIIKTLGEMGVVIHPCNLSRAGLNPIKDFYYFLSLFFLFVRHRPSIVFSYNIKPVIFGMIAAFFARVKVRTALITGLGYAFSSSSDGSRSFLSRIASFLYLMAFKCTTLVIFQNPDDRNDLIKGNVISSRKDFRIVGGSGIDFEKFKFFSYSPDVDPPVFLMLARLLVEKGVRDYAAAAARVKKIYPDCRFVLAGDFDENPNAITKAEVAGWEKDGLIEYLGRIPDVRSALRDCTAFVLPSYYREGIPRSILEAMAVGRTILTTDSVGCREPVVHGVTGYLVEPRNSSELTQRMVELIEDRALAKQMGDEGRRRAEALYDVRKVNEEMLKAMKVV